MHLAYPERRRFLRQILGAALLCTTPAAQTHWSASFRHPALQQPATLTARDAACTLMMRGSVPQTITLPLRRTQHAAHGVITCVYVGWPRSPNGRITGVRNQSADPPGARWIEQKLGPTLVWAATGCATMCVQSTLLRFGMRVLRNDATFDVIDVRSPVVECPCLAPRFASTAGERWLGAIDQPGCAIADIGDGFADLDGRRLQVAPGDRVHVEFCQRAQVFADDALVLDDEYGFTLTAELGRPAYEIEANVSGYIRRSG